MAPKAGEVGRALGSSHPSCSGGGSREKFDTALAFPTFLSLPPASCMPILSVLQLGGK